MSEVEVDHKSIPFELKDDELTDYKAYFDAYYIEKRFHIDKPRMSVQAIPTILSDTPQLILHTVETKFSVARFFGDVIAHDNLKRNFYLNRLFNDNIISFPHSLCMHAVIATSDNHILIVKRPPTLEFYPSAWQCSLSEQFDRIDLEQPLKVLHCGKRMLHEELGLDDNDGYDAENMRVLSVFLEGDLLNISLLAYIKLNLNRDELDHHLRYGLRPDLEFNNWKFVRQDDLETMLFSADDSSEVSQYHPVAKYAMYIALVHNDKNAPRKITERLKQFRVAELLAQGKQLARSGKKAEARQLLEQVTKLDAHSEEGWVWLAAVVETVEEQEICLENVLFINPNNAKAKAGLASLEDKLRSAPANGDGNQ